MLNIATVVWLLASTLYRIRDGVLTVSSGIRRRRIALADITNVTPWPHSSWQVGEFEDFSQGSKRIMISYGESRVFVSPKDQAGFLAALGFKEMSG